MDCDRTYLYHRAYGVGGRVANAGDVHYHWCLVGASWPGDHSNDQEVRRRVHPDYCGYNPCCG